VRLAAEAQAARPRVLHILRDGSDAKVRRINAWLVVALMQCAIFVGESATGGYDCHPMRPD
jgi:hypothetical protein